MHFPKHWAWGEVNVQDDRGRQHSFGAWGWSDDTPEAAKQHGQERGRRIGELVLSGQAGRETNLYVYGNGRPFREEVLEELEPGAAVISRNRFGCEVLNTTRLAFVDVDYPETPAEPAPVFWFLKPRRQAVGESPAVRQAKEKALGLLQAWLAAHPEDNFSVFETAAGLRYVLTSRPLEATAPEADYLLETLCSDERYRLLCRTQACFRARLSPKSWRIGVPRIKIYPGETVATSPDLKRWLELYEREAVNHATCRYVGDVGSGVVNPSLQRLLDLHKLRTRAGSGAPLG